MNNRVKGRSFEREVAVTFEEIGCTARGLESGGDHFVVNLNGETMHVECKRQERLKIPEWLRQQERDCPRKMRRALVFRQSKQPAYVVEPFAQFVAREAALASLGEHTHMSDRTRTPFEDTSVSTSRSQEQIRKFLRDAGAEGVQFSEEWNPPAFYVRFLWRMTPPDPDAQGVIQAVRLKVTPLPEKHAGVVKSQEQRERQAWRGIAHYLEGTLKAATFGLIRFEDIFLSFMEVEPMGRTIGEAVIARLEQGQLALPPGASS